MTGEETESRLDLARRYRPKTIDGYIGNERMVETLRKSFEGKKVSEFPRKIMVTGMTGCGKTTIARILARSFLCENPQNGKPCEECSLCKETARYVETGDYSNLEDYLKEVNVGAIRGVDAIEGITSEFEYGEGSDTYKVYIFDEFQSSTPVAQDSLLKKVEDLPDHIVVIFCTTNKEKVNETLVNRCNLDLTVRKPPMSDLVKLLQGICKQEGYKYEFSGLRDICVFSENVIRQALQNLERVLSTHKDEGASEKAVKEELDVISEEEVLSFFRAMLSGDNNKFVSLVYNVAQSGNIKQFLRYTDVLLERGLLVANGITSVEGLTDLETQKYGKIFTSFSQEELVNIATGLRKVRKGSESTIVIDLITLFYTFSNIGLVEDDDVAVIDTKKGVNEKAVRGITQDEKKQVEESRFNDNLEKGTQPLSAEDILAEWK